ncbi:MAG: P-II family nitrogen regulator [Anaerostipes sp.]|nr:P-II family nitrogen regulator [Anaerostipes sp.]
MKEELSKIEIITNMTKFTKLQKELARLGVRGMTVTQVLGCGIQKGTREFELEEEIEDFMLLPKQQISLVVETKDVREIIDTVKQVLYTGHIGDGKIFVYSLSNVVKVRTGDEGLEAL